jgi:hypothetical protein
MKENKSFPNYILNTEYTRKYTQYMFAYNAPYYDLQAYDNIAPGAGYRLWKFYLDEVKHEKNMNHLYKYRRFYNCVGNIMYLFFNY